MTQDLSNVSATIKKNLILPIWKNERDWYLLVSFFLYKHDFPHEQYRQGKEIYRSEGGSPMRSKEVKTWRLMVASTVVVICTAFYLILATTPPQVEHQHVDEPMESKVTPVATTTAQKTFSASQLSENDLKLMANAVYGEARGEPYIGQVAIAAVIINRTKSSSFPNTPSAVIFEPRAFTAVADGQIYLSPNENAKKAVKDALKGWDPTEGCTYYFNPETATSKWIWGRPQVKKIGKHIFCR
ncbi:cell wall hydrolase [Brevibacillus laterosporus]|uniref:cell wall hydrolase n=1 Tax=Brevibacillus laterosporus TaxID=1465 RepID=UPI0024072CF3|nr:cell wall hydrolase [Brevibacillus laterosporus]